MRDDLRVANVIPTLEPYTAMANTRFTHVGGGGETTTNTVLGQTGNDAIVDWVFVELRDANNPSTVVRTKSALVQRDGDVVDATDGISPLTFTGAVGQSYYVSVKHRNHLGAMTASPIVMTTSGTIVDFTSMTAAQLWNSTSSYDGFEQVDVNGKMALWAGNSNADNKVKYVGVNNDQTPVFSQVLNSSGNTTLNYNYDFATPVYISGDINMDAKVKYRGVNSDPIYIFFNVITKYATLNSGSLYNYDLFTEQIPN
ncbi:MAG: hemagglutinin protein [Flavobacterium sp.]